jgi:hypothetical protein
MQHIQQSALLMIQSGRLRSALSADCDETKVSDIIKETPGDTIK